MPDTDPRYEFRVFAENLVPVFQTMKELAGEPLIRKSEETYIVSEFCWDTNFKIRDGKLDVKVLVQQRNGLEQWMPRMKLEFPVDGNLIKDVILEDMLFNSDIETIDINEDRISETDLLELIRKIHGIEAVDVRKKRYGFFVKDVILEFAELMIDGKPVHSVAVEGTDPGEVVKWIEELDTGRRENVNYPLAIRRMVGLEPDEGGDHC